MPFLAETTVPIPTQDILSWIFDEPKYDLDKPVSRFWQHYWERSRALSTLILLIRRDTDPHRCG